MTRKRGSWSGSSNSNSISKDSKRSSRRGGSNNSSNSNRVAEAADGMSAPGTEPQVPVPGYRRCRYRFRGGQNAGSHKESILKTSFIAIFATLVLAGALSACDKRTPQAVASSDTATAVRQKVERVADRTGQAMDDIAISAKARLALAGAANLQSMGITIETVQGRVILRGRVASEAEARRAVDIVSSLEGVRSVENRLQVMVYT